MDNGYVILVIIALLFLSMYGFSYFSVAAEKIKQKREKKKELAIEEVRRLEKIKNQEIRDEKFRQFNKRKEEIQKELMLLEKMKEKQRVG